MPIGAGQEIYGLIDAGTIYPEDLEAIERVASLSLCHALKDSSRFYCLFTGYSPSSMRVLAIPHIKAADKARTLLDGLAWSGDTAESYPQTYLSIGLLTGRDPNTWLIEQPFLEKKFYPTERELIKQSGLEVPENLAAVPMQKLDLWLVSCYLASPRTLQFNATSSKFE